MLYKNENRKMISFPLGGIGSGCIGLAGNGQLIDWEIFNRPNKFSENGKSHFAVRCFQDGKIKDARILVSDIQNEIVRGGSGCSQSSLNGFPHFKSNTFKGEFPFAKLSFKDNAFPANVGITAFNPFIPLDSKNSSIPAAFFEVEFKNNCETTMEYEAAFSVQAPFKNSTNTATGNGVTVFDSDNKNNNLTVMCDCDKAYTTDYWYRGWWNSFYQDNIRTFWNEFSAGKELHNRNYSEPGHYDTCSVSGRVTVEPGKLKKIRFVISWSIPDCYNYWAPLKDKNGNDVTWKNYYATVFETSKESAGYSVKNWDYLYKETLDFTRTLYSSTLDDSIKQAIGSGLSVLKSPTVMRLEDGSLYGFEGSNNTDGSCEGLCQHVYNYAYACCYLFPDLERGIRDNELKYGVLPSGETVFRLPLPFDRKEFVNMFKNDGSKFRPCVDGQMGDIIKVYREWKLSGDDKWLKTHWDTVKRILNFAWSPDNDQLWDADCDGVIEGRQHHTLDNELFGPNGWMQGFYLAALKAAAEMAEYLEDYAAFKQYSKLFEKGYKYTKENLFNGKYFIQKINLKDKSIVDDFNCSDMFWSDELDEISYQIADGCIIDQLIGQWHAKLCGIGDIFDNKQAKTAAYNIFKNNFKESMRDFVNPWRLFAYNDDGGTVICSYPEDIKKPKNPIPYSEEVMSGFEYSFAGILIMYGLYDEAIKVIQTARKRYNGKNRNPWDDEECGHNYVRSMAAFSLIPVISGFVADLPRKKLTFSPVITQKPFKSIWSTATGWGTFELNDNKVILSLKKGNISLRELTLPFVKAVKKVLIDGKETDFSFDNGSIKIKETCICKNVEVAL